MWFRSTYFSLRSRAGFLRVGFLASAGSVADLNLTAHALQFGVQYQPEETNLGRPNTTMMPSSTEMIQANADGAQL